MSKVFSSKKSSVVTQSQFYEFSYKAACRLATTAAVTLSSQLENGDTLDVVTLATGDRILVKDQSSGSENGIYTVNASGAPTRAEDFNASSEVTGGAFVNISEGTANGNKSFVLTTDDAITLGSTALTFTEITAAASKVTLTGNATAAENDLIPFVADAGASTGSHALEMHGAFHYRPSTGTVTATEFSGSGASLTSSTSGKPLVTLETTNATTGTSSELKFQKNVIGEATAQLGKISFWGQDDDDNLTQFGEINSTIYWHIDTAEKGRIEFKVATYDSTITTGLRIDGTSATGRVDTYLGGNSSSLIVSNGNLVTPKFKMTGTDGVSSYDTSNGFTVHTTDDRVLVWDKNDDYIKFAELSDVCFLKGTKITLANGKQRSIEDLTLEDKVLTYNIEGLSKIRNKNYVYKWSTDEMKGSFSESGIKKIWINPTDSYLVINDILRITGHHLIHFKRDNRYYFNFAEALQMGDELMTDNNNYEKIETIEEVKEEQNVYNFEVDKDQTYFADNYLVHHYCKLCSGYANII